ncbi:MAG: hypothetical protein GY727_08195 [Gammaproteobacteria bacterium]|nr:hypothetical protein [Gammaproteobacteria bacterium]MCP4088720.1 hypothetical protein [Gammaproteobacteria bacterium]MCP4275237.1 hypothetical protein [Gammaproteobacteria bacterium]MCP4830753.1 hypothetical protein [Gammaproteobacteria bacterium]MCP4929542.1 hypothetical protein [Gammaproteobacteria bacterium]
MIILGIEFLGLIVICYIFLAYAMNNHVAGGKGKLTPAVAIGVTVLMVLAMLMFASWYIRLGLA